MKKLETPEPTQIALLAINALFASIYTCTNSNYPSKCNIFESKENDSNHQSNFPSSQYRLRNIKLAMNY